MERRDPRTGCWHDWQRIHPENEKPGSRTYECSRCRERWYVLPRPPAPADTGEGWKP